MDSIEDDPTAQEAERMLNGSSNGSMTGSRNDILRPQQGVISIQRNAQTHQSLIEDYELQQPERPSIKQKLNQYLKSNCLFTKTCLIDRLFRFFPFIRIIQNYQWKSWLYLDILSGISVGVIHIPQGMGFALLTSVPPVFGLYSSFFPLLFYFFFGGSKHISMGTMALISLMIGAVVDREVTALGFSSEIDDMNGTLSINETEELQNNLDMAKVGIAVSVSLLVGIFQFAMGFVGLGIVATFMSMPFVGSFLTGAAVHIITSQVPSVFGLKLKRHSGIFKVPLTYYEVFAHITDTNVCALITSIICLTILIVLKEIINEKFKSKLKIPIPAELLVVVLGTLISHFGRLNQKFEMKIVGHIPKGIPAPRVPPMTNATNYIGDSILVAIISFAISITMAKLMASKHSYEIDVNQELYAYGICHAGSSFFNCFAGAQAPPRTLVHDSIGGKTQISGLVSAVLVLLVLLVIAPLFYSLPVSVLASVIIAALLPLFKQFKTLPNIRRVNVLDLVVWVVTFVAVVVLDITFGLAIGVGLSIFLVVLHSYMVSGDSLINLTNSELYIPSHGLQEYKNMPDVSGVRVFRFDAPLFFANTEKFKTQLFAKTINFRDLRSMKDKMKAIPVDEPSNGEISSDNSTDRAGEDSEYVHDKSPEHGSNIYAIIIDCSAISYVDLMGINLIKTLKQGYEDVGIRLVLANCDFSLMSKLRAGGIVKDDPENNVLDLTYPSIQDAVAAFMPIEKSTNL